MSDAIVMLTEAISRLRDSTVTLGPETVVETEPLAVEGAGGEAVQIRHTSGWTTGVGDQILALRVGEDVWGIGVVSPPHAPPATGLVASATGSLVTVNLGGTYGNAIW